jgi:hypothetical protein
MKIAWFSHVWCRPGAAGESGSDRRISVTGPVSCRLQTGYHFHLDPNQQELSTETSMNFCRYVTRPPLSVLEPAIASVRVRSAKLLRES